MWKKALVMVVASLVVTLPLLTQVSAAQTASTQKQEAHVVLPQGKELSDKELQKADGEVGPIDIIAAGIAGGTINAAMELGDELYHHNGISGKQIAVSFAEGFGAGVVAIPGTRLVCIGLKKAIYWTARAAAVAGPAAVSLGTRISNGFKTAGYAMYNGFKTAGYAIYNGFKSFGRLFGRK